MFTDTTACVTELGVDKIAYEGQGVHYYNQYDDDANGEGGENDDCQIVYEEEAEERECYQLIPNAEPRLGVPFDAANEEHILDEALSKRRHKMCRTQTETWTFERDHDGFTTSSI